MALRQCSQGSGGPVGVVLAAGRSARMGQAKALLRVGAETFVERLTRTFSHIGAAPVVVVASSEGAPSIAAVVSELASIVINPDPDRGQLSSLQCALSALPPDTPAVLIAPVDVPLVCGQTVEALIDAWHRTGADLVRPTSHAGRHGHPVLVAGGAIDALRSASLDRTARDVLRTFAASTTDVLVDDEGAFVDIDTPEEYERVVGSSRW